MSKQVRADPGADRRGRGFTGSSVSGHILGEISRDRRDSSWGSRWHRAGGKRGTVSYSEVSGIVTVYLLSQWLKAPCTPVDGRPLL